MQKMMIHTRKTEAMLRDGYLKSFDKFIQGELLQSSLDHW